MKRIMAPVIALLLCSTAAAGGSAKELATIDDEREACLLSATSTVSTKDCNAEANEKVDRILNRDYQAIIKRLDINDEYAAATLNKLKIAQRAWITFRDAQCDLEADQMQGGTGAGVVWGDCLYRLTVERVKALETRFPDE